MLRQPETTRRWWMSAALLALSVLGSWQASAQTDPGDAASALFLAGRDAARRGDYPAACPKFAESYSLAPKAGTLFNLADCQERIGNLAAAMRFYRSLLHLLTREDDRLPVVTERLATLEPRVPRLILIGPRPPDLRIQLDGVELTAADVDAPIPVEVGNHRVVLTTGGAEPRRMDLSLREGERREISLAPPASPPLAAAPDGRSSQAAPRAENGSPARTTGYVLGGIGVASLTVSVVTGALALSRKSTFTAHCDASFGCDGTGLDAASSGKTLTTVSTVAFAIGVATVGVGAYLLLTSDHDGPAAGVSAIPGGGAFLLGGHY